MNNFFRSILVLGAAVSLSAQTFFDRSFLNEQDLQTAAAGASGGIHAADAGSPMQGAMNPALLLRPGTGIALYSQVRGRQHRESRSFPVLDSFDSFLADNIYVQNHRFNAFFDAGLSWSAENVSLAAALFRRYDLNYRYDEEVRGSLFSVYNRDPLIGYHSVAFDGAISALNIAAAYSPIEKLSLGLGLSFLSAEELSDAYGVTVLGSPADNLASDTTNFSTYEYSMDAVTELHAGLNYDFSDRLSLQGSARLSPELPFSDAVLHSRAGEATGYPSYTLIPDSLSAVSFAFPDRYSLGLSYTTANTLPTRLYLQLDFLDWSAMDASDEDSLSVRPNSTWTLRGAVNHRFFTGVPFRVGFSYQPSPVSTVLNRSVLSFGSGFRSEKISLDFAVDFTEVRYRYPDLFPIQGEIRNALDTVREQSIRYTLALSAGL